MRTAVITFVYNEAVNLPIWRRYYGGNFGEENLYVADRGSTDGSVDGLGKINVLRLPRDKFDENAKTDFMSFMHRSLLSFYDTVIITDCDEIIVPDPEKAASLQEYVEAMPSDYVNCIGIDVLHLLNSEMPLDLAQPILSQRSFGRYHSPSCKPLVSRVAMRWLPGFHCSDRPPFFDGNLYMFHLKVMDYSLAMERQRINVDTAWSEKSLAHNYGSHHRIDYATFVKGNFLAPMDAIARGNVSDFVFAQEISTFLKNTVKDAQGNYRIPVGQSKIVRIPDRFRTLI